MSTFNQKPKAYLNHNQGTAKNTIFSTPRLSILSIAIMSSFSFSAFATEEQKNSESNTDTMVVTAAGFEQTVKQAPASISVVTREDLDSRYYRDVTDALKSVPGVVVTNGGDKTDISLRGMGANYTLILVDGKRQSSRQTRPNSDGSGVEQGWLPPLSAIDRIEVIRGPMSTLYGSDALGGVINVITRKDAQEWTGNVQLGTVIQEDSASGNEQSVNFFLNGPVSDKLSLQLYGESTNRDEDKIIEGYEDKSLQSITSKLTYQANDNHSLTFEAGASKQERKGNPGYTLEDTDEAAFDEYNRNHFSVTHDGDWGDVGMSQTFLEYEMNDNKTRKMKIDNLLFKSNLVTMFDYHTLTTGFEVSYADLEDHTSNSGSDETQLDSTQWAVFAEDEWAIFDSFSLTMGARVDHDENFDYNFSPRVYGVWTMTKEWTLKGGVSTGFRAPQLRELTEGWVQASNGGNIYGNPDLEPEKSVNTEIGLLYSNDYGVDGGITLFYNDFDDKITRIDCPVGICGTAVNSSGNSATYKVNVDKAITQGVELTLNLPITENIKMKNSYTYIDSEQKSGEYEGEPLFQQPEHLFSSELTWQNSDKLNSWAKVTYHGEELDPTTGPSSSSITAPSYTFVDTGITYAINDNLKAKAAIYNIFDEEVTYEEYDYVEDGRRYWVGLDMSF